MLSSDYAYIPVYEHGYGVFKNHQLVIGAQRVSWKEYLFFQSFHNKQDVINSLKTTNEVVVINHPKLRGAYSADDLKNLRGYDLLEVASHSFFDAEDLWDSVLSSGRRVFVIANDDNHNIHDAEEFGFVYTMVNTPSLKKDDVLEALRSGKAYGVELEPQKDTSVQNKILEASLVPKLISCFLNNNVLSLKFDKKSDSLILIGQNGVIKDYELNADSISYAIQDNDTYIRPEIKHGNMINVFLNPVFRYDGNFRGEQGEIDLQKTWLFRAVYLLVIAAVAWSYFKFKK